jgi:hypothetical protein
MKKTEAELEQIARAIGVSNYLAYTASISGQHGAARELYDRMKDVRVGDMVIEITTILMSVAGKHYRPALDAVGHLVKITREKIVFSDPDFVWNEEEEGQPHPTEKCTYVKTLDGREFRWTNASFISVQTEYPTRKRSEEES